METKTLNKSNRISFTYTKEVLIPPKYHKFLWAHPEKECPLEKLIIRILRYGNYNNIKWIFKTYPEETKI